MAHEPLTDQDAQTAGSAESEDFDAVSLFLSPEGASAPQPGYREILERCPVQRTEFNGAPSAYLSRYEDVHFALRHPEIFSSADSVQIGNERPLIPLQLDPPEHAKYRRILDPELSPRWMEALEGETRALVKEHIDAFAERGSCDFHAEFAEPLPSAIFLKLFGLPLDEREQFFRWRDNIIRPDVGFDFEAAAEIRAQTGQEMYAYFRGVLDERRQNPDDALLSRLLSAEVDGHVLSDEEILDISYLFLIAGLDTVTATLECSITYLARNPDRRKLLVEDPSLVDAVVEELLRWETPVQLIPRSVTQAVTIGGVDLEPGDGVTLVLGAANVDGSQFEDCELVRFDRTENRHLAFGGGPHRCLGSHLARMELRVALEEWHRSIPDYEIPDGTELTFSPGIRQTKHLPLVWTT